MADPSLHKDLNMSTLGDSSSALSYQRNNGIFKELRDCGLEKYFTLPKIVTIGNQSAGKSSLTEAISRIKVPRANDKCTRCPTEVILSCGESETWRWIVSLRIAQKDVVGQTLGKIIFGETYSRDELELILRRAQLAILNPSEPWQKFANLSDQECKEKENEDRLEIIFSENTIVVDIIGADTNLTFIDLPGIIANTKEANLFMYL